MTTAVRQIEVRYVRPDPAHVERLMRVVAELQARAILRAAQRDEDNSGEADGRHHNDREREVA